MLAVDHLGNVTFLIPVAEHLTGWTSAEAEGQPVEAVFTIVNISTRGTVANPVREAIASQRPVELANHTILIDRHGEETPINDSAATILTQLGSGLDSDSDDTALDQVTETRSDSGQSVVGAVLIFRSIEDRRGAERKVEPALDYAENIVETVRESMLVWDDELKVVSANRSFNKRFSVGPQATAGSSLFESGNDDRFPRNYDDHSKK